MATLHVLQGPDKGRTYHTTGDVAVIGRTAKQVQLSDGGTSRRHAEVRREGDSWVLADLGSSNGTFLNGQRLGKPTPLHHGDQIRVGNSLLVFSGHDDPDAIEPFTRVHDLVDFESSDDDAAIITSCDASAESQILEAPETTDAVLASKLVFQVAESIGVNESIDAFLDRVADILYDGLGADRFAMLLCEGNQVRPEPQRVRIRLGTDRANGRIVTSRRIIQQAIDSRTGVLSTNVISDARFSGADPGDSLVQLGYRSVICAPVFVRDRIYALIHLDTSATTQAFRPQQLRLVVAIGRLVGLAIENAQLQESRVRNERLAAAGETVAYLSHHIKNLLQGIQSGSEILQNALEKEGTPRLRSGWAMVRRNLDRILVLTTNMLTFSKDRKPHIETADLKALIEDVLQQSSARAQEQDVVLASDLGSTPPVKLDRVGMSQVILNIVFNALDAVPDHEGRIQVSSHYNAERKIISVSITDNGPGIEPGDHERIFDPFHSSKGHAGTGLGLAAARKIVAEHGGRIDVDSAVGKGTTFHIRIPTDETSRFDPEKTRTVGFRKDPDDQTPPPQ